MQPWLLPENIADVLPSEARRIEDLRRRLLDLYRSYGFELVMPPLIEHLDSLLTGAGSDLGLRTFKLVDQLSGRTLGVRADMTPQVARIDAHLLNRNGVARLCYAGSVLHTRVAGPFGTREPFHVGAELYGHEGIEADLEILELVVRSLGLAGCERMRVDISHVGIVPALLACFGTVPGLDEQGLSDLLQSKDLPTLAQALQAAPAALRESLTALTRLHGRLDGAEAASDGVVARARASLPPEPAIVDALARIEKLAASPLWRNWPQVELSVDLADLRGYRYHSGLTFAVYVDGLPYAVARGGRYDGAGRIFGRARPATGFSLELRALAGLTNGTEPAAAIRAPWSDDAGLRERVAALRASGEVVIQALPGSAEEQQEFVCDRELVAVSGGGWAVRTIEGE